MNCPICNMNLGLSEAHLKMDELHYDCPHCDSSFFFQNGEYQILNENSIPSKSPSPSPSPSHVETSAMENLENKNEEFNTILGDKFQEEPSIDSQEEEKVSDSSFKKQEEEKVSDSSFTKQEEEKVSDSSFKKQEEEEEESEFQEAIESENSSKLNDDSSLQNSPKENFSDIEEYGNKADISIESVFYYDLQIQEINSAQLRQEIKMVLEDKALGLDPEAYFLKIKDGVLEISKLSPVKVHVIIKALIGLPLTLKWNQSLVVDKT